VTLDSTATFSIRLGVGTTSDKLKLTGALTLNQVTLTLDLSSFDWDQAVEGTNYRIVAGGAGATGVGTNVFSQGSTYTAENGAVFGIHYATTADGTGVGNDVVLTLQTIPEPATWSMIVGGLGMMAFMQRARRRMTR